MMYAVEILSEQSVLYKGEMNESVQIVCDPFLFSLSCILHEECIKGKIDNYIETPPVDVDKGWNNWLVSQSTRQIEIFTTIGPVISMKQV